MKNLMVFKIITICCIICFCTQIFSNQSCFDYFKLDSRNDSLSIQSKLKHYTLFFTVSEILEEIIKSGETKGSVELFWIEYENGDNMLAFHTNFEGDAITIDISDSYLREKSKTKTKINLLTLAKERHSQEDYSYLKFQKVLFTICENPHIDFKLKKHNKVKNENQTLRKLFSLKDWFDKINFQLGLDFVKLTIGMMGLTFLIVSIGAIVFFDDYIIKRFKNHNKISENKYFSYFKTLLSSQTEKNAKRILRLLEITTKRISYQRTQKEMKIIKNSN